MQNFEYYNHLGFHNPYYILDGNKIVLESTFEKIIDKVPKGSRELNFTGLVELMSTGFCFGDRTLIKGVNKTPWMAKPNSNFTDWNYFELPAHGDKVDNNNNIANLLYINLQEELITYIKDHKNIGILLTGGMDSRIVAAIIKNSIECGILSDKNIYAFTWGNEQSRDVVYAARIAKMYNWTWKHLVVDSDQMSNNCEIAIANGCEYTPLHLHAMSQISKETYLDCVVAGSFGDSVGRAEFSGQNVTTLTSLKAKINNSTGFIREDYQKLILNDMDQDIDFYHKKFPREHIYQQYELDQQLHYMRRMLNSCMSTINRHIPLYQMFSSPNTYGYMWSLSPRVRTDLIYKQLLEARAPELLAIPWARTGLKYPDKEGKPDLFTKKHHNYSKMIRKDFLEKISRTIKEYDLKDLGVFNMSVVHDHINYIKWSPISGTVYYEERLLWLACFAKFIRTYNITVNLPQNRDSVSRLLYAKNYYGRYLYRLFKK